MLVFLLALKLMDTLMLKHKSPFSSVKMPTVAKTSISRMFLKELPSDLLLQRPFITSYMTLKASLDTYQVTSPSMSHTEAHLQSTTGLPTSMQHRIPTLCGLSATARSMLVSRRLLLQYMMVSWLKSIDFLQNTQPTVSKQQAIVLVLP